MRLDKYLQLKIAFNVLGITLNEFAESLDVHPHNVREVANDRVTSARISKAIDETIAKAERIYEEHRAQQA